MQQRGAVAFTFDDDFAEQWHALMPIFEPHGARATFFVCRAGELSDQQVSLLRDLQDAGHEIGSHGMQHRSVLNDYQADPARLTAYLAEEIAPSRATLESQGFKVSSFAYPYGHHTPEWNQALQQEFRHVRTTAYKKRLRPPHWLRSIYHRPGDRGQIHSALGIDENYGITDQQLIRILRKAADRNLIVSFYAHCPGEQGRDYIVRPARLAFICEQARALGMGFRTMSEFDQS